MPRHAGITALSMLRSRVVALRIDRGEAADICTEAIRKDEHIYLRTSRSICPFVSNWERYAKACNFTCSRVHIEKLTVPQLDNKVSVSNEIRRFITVLRRPVHWTYSEPDEFSL